MSKSVTVNTPEELGKALADRADEIRIEGSWTKRSRTLMPIKPATWAIIVAAQLLVLLAFAIHPILLLLAMVAFGAASILCFKAARSTWSLLRYKTVERDRDYVVLQHK